MNLIRGHHFKFERLVLLFYKVNQFSSRSSIDLSAEYFVVWLQIPLVNPASLFF